MFPVQHLAHVQRKPERQGIEAGCSALDVDLLHAIEGLERSVQRLAADRCGRGVVPQQEHAQHGVPDELEHLATVGRDGLGDRGEVRIQGREEDVRRVPVRAPGEVPQVAHPHDRPQTLARAAPERTVEHPLAGVPAQVRLQQLGGRRARVVELDPQPQHGQDRLEQRELSVAEATRSAGGEGHHPACLARLPQQREQRILRAAGIPKLARELEAGRVGPLQRQPEHTIPTLDHQPDRGGVRIEVPRSAVRKPLDRDACAELPPDAHREHLGVHRGAADVEPEQGPAARLLQPVDEHRDELVQPEAPGATRDPVDEGAVVDHTAT